MSAKIITIDGPSAVGKGTIAQCLANEYRFHLLDSGALYRVVAVNTLRLGIDPDAAEAVADGMQGLAVDFDQGQVFLSGENVSECIREEATGQIASRVAVHPIVRQKLFDFMQAFVKKPGIVADGRDMGTVVFPQADLKLFLTASTEVRAKRRYKQLKDNGKDVILGAVFSELEARDRRDSGREVAPLKPAKDAIVIDTGTWEVKQVFDYVKNLCSQHGIVP